MWHDVEQNTDEWYALRAGKITSSNLHTVMAHFGKDFGNPAKKYAVDIAVSQLTGKPPPQGFTNDHMKRGHEEEPLARMAYEEMYFCEITNGGFFEKDGFGDSPDGLVGNEGMVEIKSAIPSVHYDRIRKGTYDSSYKWQHVGHLKASKRKWVDFVSFCSQFPDDKKLYVHRLHKRDFIEEFNQVDIRLAEFKKLIEKVKKNIVNGDYETRSK